ncbi:MAG: beta-lactamase family protein [Bacteroidales bacterium]|nr:beta-lactamase family protein [Bacteroidales bacterium]MDD4673900.1 beta-lactamase family protein [Bacteroidales bacterium]
MKRFFLFLMVTLMTNVLFAQAENYSAAIDSFQTNYNTEKYDEIFNSFSSKMKQSLPLENTKQFLMNLRTQFGKIENKEFVNYQKGAYASYKTQFEKAILSVNISLDDHNKINGLSIKPYEEVKVNESKAINALGNYPKEISNLFFSKCKNFPNNTQLSVAIIHNDEINYYGIIKENDTIKPIDNKNKIFEIGSITKVFTSTVLVSLVEDNKFKLADYINSYYSFPFKDNTKITFESLANHTSGLPRLPENLDLTNAHNPYKNYGEKALNEYLENMLKLENEPAKVYSYSNLGAGLLGYTLGVSQKTSFQKLLQDRIFEKFRMTNSFTSSNNLNNSLVKGLNSNGEIVSNWDFDALFGAGGILSSTEDLAKFAKAQLNPKNRELALSRKPTFNVNEKMEIGLGWHILKSENDKELFWHNGGTAGYSSSIAINLEGRNAVIILSNVSAFNPKMKNIDNLCFELIGTLENK